MEFYLEAYFYLESRNKSFIYAAALSPETDLKHILCVVLNLSSHPFEAVKVSNPTSFATSKAFAWSNGPLIGTRFALALQNHLYTTSSIILDSELEKFFFDSSLPFFQCCSFNSFLFERMSCASVFPMQNFFAAWRLDKSRFSHSSIISIFRFKDKRFRFWGILGQNNVRRYWWKSKQTLNGKILRVSVTDENVYNIYGKFLRRCPLSAIERVHVHKK